jgi:PPOX class probable F420-dependent enzyme
VARLPDEVRALFEGRNFAHLATLMPDGSPHSVAVWTDLEGDRIVFFTQPGTRKARNLERDPRVALSIQDDANLYRSAQVRGRVVETRAGEEALRVIDRLARKYTGEPFPMRTGTLYLVEPERSGFMVLPFRHEPAS